jgi:hypothetical protein
MKTQRCEKCKARRRYLHKCCACPRMICGLCSRGSRSGYVCSQECHALAEAAHARKAARLEAAP